jgi:hypothetical protein
MYEPSPTDAACTTTQPSSPLKCFDNLDIPVLPCAIIDSVEANDMRLAALFQRTPKVGKCVGALAITLAISTTLAQSQFTPPPKTAIVTGIVTDSTGDSIPNAAVRLKAAEGFTLETKTELDGRFAMDAWPGEYTLNISSREFETLSEPVSLAATINLTKHVVLSVGYCNLCATVSDPIELEVPNNPLTATLPLKPLPPLKLRPRYLKKSPTVT